MIPLVYTRQPNKKSTHSCEHFLRVTVPRYKISVKLAGLPSSPSMDGMPGPEGFKVPDAAFECFAEQKEALHATDQVISALPEVSQTVLRGLIEGLPEHTIAYQCGYGHSQYYQKIRPHAIYLFSLYYPLDHFDEKDTPA